MTGEFPPRIESIKTQYQSLMELKKNSALMIKSATERMQKAQIEPVAATASLPQPEQNQNLQQEIREMRVEQLRMHNQVETLVQQNRELIKILTMPRSN